MSRFPKSRCAVSAWPFGRRMPGAMGACVIVAACCALRAYAEKVLVYDEEKGIIYVDKDKKDEEKGAKKPAAPPRLAVPQVQKTRDRSDIHVGRKKDPPELYFKSGLQYFRNEDYINALKNFTYAEAADPRSEYLLWMGKTYRQLDQHEKMLSIMDKIRAKFPDSDVADDALFEIAFYYQRNDDYHMATEKYAELAEEYPYGVAYSSGEEFLEMSRTQRQLMRAELITALKVLGFEGSTPHDAYRAFQSANGLEQSGNADRPTVTAIKKKYQEKLQSDSDASQQKEHVSLSTIWSIGAGVLLILNFWILLMARLKAQQRKRQLASLESILSDMDIRKL